jgi:hypothetical protein
VENEQVTTSATAVKYHTRTHDLPCADISAKLHAFGEDTNASTSPAPGRLSHIPGTISLSGRVASLTHFGRLKNLDETDNGI